eukprot:4334783-Ditylum_brightwellii.AAC.1
MELCNNCNMSFAPTVHTSPATSYTLVVMAAYVHDWLARTSCLPQSAYLNLGKCVKINIIIWLCIVELFNTAQPSLLIAKAKQDLERQYID